MTGRPEHFDAVIVGSGFGGAVTAARLAEAGWRVCVLERGEAYPPNSFPRSPLDMKHNFWDPADGRHGMFDLWEFDNIDAVCASGLGGGSLIYADAHLRKDEHWFVNERRLPRRLPDPLPAGRGHAHRHLGTGAEHRHLLASRPVGGHDGDQLAAGGATARSCPGSPTSSATASRATATCSRSRCAPGARPPTARSVRG